MHKPYQALGWKVFPLKGKVPHKWRPKEWGHTYDPKHYKDATGIGVLCIPSGMVVIDVDTTRGDGHASMAEIEAKHGLDMRAACKALCRSGRDGLHYYFDAPQGTYKFKGKINDKIDIKANGYVVAPPSIHPDNGVFYEWEIEPRIGHHPVPPEVLDMMIEHAPTAPPRPHSLPYEGDSLIEKIRADAHIPTLLTEAGYRQIGRSWLSPSSSSGIAGVKVLDDGKIFSHHSNCVLAAAQTGHSLDAVDVMRILRYGGSRDAMIADYAAAPKDAPTWDPALAAKLESMKAPPKISKRKRPRHRLDELAKDIQAWDLPGRAHEIYDWIDSQCNYQRQNLAVGATLWVLSCLAGMRHVDSRDEINLNLLVFGVAGSATGKEAIIQAATRLLSHAGVTRALHGKIKSEQEIYRNLIDHQAAFYLVDEIGIFMQKLSNSQKSGAHYLEGVIGAIMEISTKAQGILAITGDQKRELVEGLEKRIALLTKAVDNGHEGEEALASLYERIAQAEHGLHSPYLTLYGATTPQTFDQILTPENAQNGLLGRALVLREYEDNPPLRGRTGPKEPPHSLVTWLNYLYWGASYDANAKRVERQGERVAIATEEEAAAMLDEIYGIFFQIADEHKEKTGLAAIPRRGWENASKISMLLGVADGKRTAQHVLYAYAMARKDCDMKLRFAFANAQESAEEAQAACVAAVLSVLDLQTGSTERQIKRRSAVARRHPNLPALLVALEQAQRIRSEKTPHTTRYYLTEV